MSVQHTQDYDGATYIPAAPVVDIRFFSPHSPARSATTTALLDTGADATMLPADALRDIGAQFLELRQMRGLTGVGVTVETFLCSIALGPFVVPGLQVVALNAGSEAILGRDAISALVVTLNGPAGVVEISS